MRTTVSGSLSSTARSPDQNALTDRFFAFLGLGLLLGVTAMMAPDTLLIYGLFLAALTAATLVDRRSLPSSESLKAEISMPRGPVLGTSTAVTLRLWPQDGTISRLSELEIHAPESDLLRFRTDRWRLRERALQGTELTLDLPAEVAKLGYEMITRVDLGARSRLGLWHRSMALNVPPAEFRAAPEQKEIGEQAFREILATQRLLVEGARMQARSRANDQFVFSRKYQSTDSIRHLDHKKTAKLGQLMTKVHDSFFSHHVILALDVGRAMQGQVRGSSKHDFYLSACLLLGRNAVKSRDRISFFSFSSELHSLVSKTRNLAPFEGLFKGLASFTPRETESDFEIINQTVARVSGQRSIVLVLTDASRPSVQEALLEKLGPLCAKHVVVVLSLVEKSLQLEDKILALNAGHFGETAETFNETFSGVLYDYWAHERFLLFRSRLSSLGGATLRVSHDNWMTVVDRLYFLLRNSIYA